jgi:hypothetical protein
VGAGEPGGALVVAVGEGALLPCHVPGATMAAMTIPTAARTVTAALLLSAAGLLAGCGGGATPTPASPTPSAGDSPGPSTAASPSPSAVPSPGPSVSGSPSPTVGQTTTDWGVIWDAVPATFPRYVGGETVEPDQPASLAYDVDAPAETVTTDLQASMESGGFSTDSLSGPFEDGSRVIDSTGEPPACHVRTTIAPLGATTRVTVLYGVDCPPG